MFQPLGSISSTKTKVSEGFFISPYFIRCLLLHSFSSPFSAPEIEKLPKAN